jgi:chromosome segregation ATPase
MAQRALEDIGEHNDEDLDEIIKQAEASKRRRREICEQIGRQRQRNARLEREQFELLEFASDLPGVAREVAEQRNAYDAKERELTQARRCAGDAEAQASISKRKAQELDEQLRGLQSNTTGLEASCERLRRRRRLREFFASVPLAPVDVEGFKSAYLECCRCALEQAGQAVRRASEALALRRR